MTSEQSAWGLLNFPLQQNSGEKKTNLQKFFVFSEKNLFLNLKLKTCVGCDGHSHASRKWSCIENRDKSDHLHHIVTFFAWQHQIPIQRYVLVSV